MRRNLRHRFSSSCAHPEQWQEEERRSGQSQNVTLTLCLCQRNPQIFEILRVHSQEGRILASRRQQRPAHPLPHLQVVGEEKREFDGSAVKKQEKKRKLIHKGKKTTAMKIQEIQLERKHLLREGRGYH